MTSLASSREIEGVPVRTHVAPARRLSEGAAASSCSPKLSPAARRDSRRARCCADWNHENGFGHDVADTVDGQQGGNISASHFKWNEGRASAWIPAVKTCSSFFTIYAYAQALDQSGNIGSESLTKTLVEVDIETLATATTPAVYKVKKLYAQNIPLGQ